jgi:DNA-binding transcriptional MerR regulator
MRSFNLPFPVDTPPYLCTRPLAELIGVHPATVENWAKLGIIPPAVRISARFLVFNTKAVEAALLAKVSEPVAPTEEASQLLPAANAAESVAGDRQRSTRNRRAKG